MNPTHLFLQAFRSITHRPGYAAVVVLTLTLGIGVTTAVFSIFHAVLLSPLPYPAAQELVAVFDTQPACNACPASFPKYHDWRDRNQVFASIGGMTGRQAVLTGHGDPDRLRVVAATESLGEVFRTSPRLGRWFTAAEDQPGGPKVTLLSAALWRRLFEERRDVIGQKVVLDGEPHEIIGVLPPRPFPAQFGALDGDAFVPLQQKLDPATRGNHFLMTYARLKPGIEAAEASRQMRALGADLAREFGHNHGIDVRPLTDVLSGGVRTPLNLLLGAVLFVLLIGAANVANLMLAGGIARRRELAVRQALGAGVRNLAGLLAAEGLLLAAAGGALGILLAIWLVSSFTVLAGNQLPRTAQVEMNLPVLAFAILASGLVGLICSVFPILWVGKRDLASEVRQGDVRGGSHSGNRVRAALVVTEIALAFALLAGSALLVKNLLLLQGRDPGIRTSKVVTFSVALAGPRYQDNAPVVAFYRDLTERLRSMNQVERAGLISHVPMIDFGFNGEFQVDGDAPWAAKDAPLVEYRWIHGDALTVLGVPLVKGRMLEERDGDGTRTVLINQAMAEKFWPNQDPIGRRFGQGSDRSKWYEVVGVIGNVRSYGLAANQPFEFYRRIEQSAFGRMSAVIETRAEDPLAVIPEARRAVAALDPSIPITNIKTMERAVAESLGRPRFFSSLTALFGLIAGVLALVGIYSVMAYTVNRQRREFGVRLALGAAPSSLRRMVLAQSLKLAGIGIALGGAAAWAFSGVLQSVLNDVRPTDPWVYASTIVAVFAVSAVAAYLPAVWASRVDPAEILRSE